MTARRETFACFLWALVVGAAAFVLLLALTACDGDPVPTPPPAPGLVCTTTQPKGDGPPIVECQRFPGGFELPTDVTP